MSSFAETQADIDDSSVSSNESIGTYDSKDSFIATSQSTSTTCSIVHTQRRPAFGEEGTDPNYPVTIPDTEDGMEVTEFIDCRSEKLPLTKNWKRMSRSWCFTLNNYSEADEQFLKDLEKKYLVFGREVGESGTPHLQGFITFNGPKRFPAVKKLMPKAHWEQAVASDAGNYCMKDRSYYLEDNRKTQGKREDLRAATQLAISEGREALLANLPHMYVKYHGGFDKLVLMKSNKRSWVPTVYWIYGPTGVGKTRWVHQEEDEDNLWVSMSTLRWWDGYESQSAVLLDDLRGENVAFDYLLRILDRYQFMVQVKGGCRQLVARRIYITAPISPREMYGEAKGGFTNEDIGQLLRRITKVIHVPSIEAGTMLRELGPEIYSASAFEERPETPTPFLTPARPLSLPSAVGSPWTPSFYPSPPPIERLPKKRRCSPPE